MQVAPARCIHQEFAQPHLPPGEPAALERRRVEAEQAFDLPLQADHVVLQDIDHLTLGDAELPRNLLPQQRHPLAQRGQRRFEFVRNVAQGALAVGLQFGQSLPEPVQLPPQLPEVGRSADHDRFVETLFAKAGNRLLQIAQRTHQPPAHGQHDQERPGQRHGNLPAEAQAAGLQLGQKLAVLGIDPMLAGRLQQTVQVGQAPHHRHQIVSRHTLIETAAQGFGLLAPIGQQ